MHSHVQEAATPVAGHTDSVTGARISADGESTVTYSSDGTARAWNLSTGNCMAVFQHNSAVALAVFSPDGAHVASCAADCSPMLWEVSSGRSVHKLAVRPWLFGHLRDALHVMLAVPSELDCRGSGSAFARA